MEQEHTHDERFKKHISARYGADTVYVFGVFGGLFSFFLIMLFIFCTLILGAGITSNNTQPKIISVGIEDN